MPIGSNVASIARVAFEADTGRFNADITAARAHYERNLGQMSDDAVRLSLAQEKLDRAIAKFGPSSRQAAQAGVALRREERAIQQQAAALERQQIQTNRSINQLDGTARRSSGGLMGLGRSVRFAAGAFIGATGLIYGLRSVLAASKEAQVVEGQVAVAVRNTGLEYGRYQKQIEATLRAQARLSAFDDEELASSFAALVTRTKDVNEALRLNAIAADVARGRNMSLEAASRLVLRASLGNAGALKRLGLDVEAVTTAQARLKASGDKVTEAQKAQAKASDAAATKQSLVARLQAAYTGQAERYARSSAGSQDRFNVSLEDTKEILGNALLPALAEGAGGLARWLDRMNQSGQLQRNVNTVVRDGASAFRGIASAVRTFTSVLRPAVDLIGGIDKAVQLFLIVGALAKLRRFAAGFAVVRAQSALTRTAVVADMAAISAASAVAPTTVATGRGRPGAPGRAPRVIPVGGPLGIIATTLGLTFGGPAIRAADARIGGRDIRRITPAELASALTLDQLEEVRPLLSDSQYRQARAIMLGRLEARPDEGTRGTPGRTTTPDRRPDGRGAGGRRGRRGPSEQDLLLRLARAQATGGDRAQVGALGALARFYREEIRALERRRNLTDEQKQKLASLYQQLGSTEDSIEAIHEANEREEDARDSKREAAEKRRRAAEKRRNERRRKAAKEARDKRLEEVGQIAIGVGLAQVPSSGEVSRLRSEMKRQQAAKAKPEEIPFAVQQAAFLEQLRETIYGESASNIFTRNPKGGLTMGSQPITIIQHGIDTNKPWQAARDAELAVRHRLS